MAIITSGYTGSKARHLEMVNEQVGNETWDIFDGLFDDEPSTVDVAAVARSFFGFAKPILNPVAYSEFPVIFDDFDYKECH